MRKLISWAFAAAVLISQAGLPSRAWAQSGTVTDDGFLSSNSTTQILNLNGQGISLIVAGSSATVGSTQIGTTKTFIKFQLSSSLPPNIAAANVAKATLKLYLSPLTNPTGAIDIYPITSAWTESTLTTAPPTVAPTAFVTGVALGKANSFLVIDVTPLVQQWLNGLANGGLDNDGIAIEANTSTTHVVFDSKESIVTSHEPRLEIVLVHSGPAGAAATIQVGSTTTVGAGGAAAVTNTGTSSAAVFNFAIPQGQPGTAGQMGPAGQAASITVGPTVTLSPGAPASVLTGGTPNAPILNFLIPQGAVGASGLQGPKGPAGLTNRGGWNISTNYGVNDAVSDSGSYWLALVASGPVTSNSCQPAYPPDPCSQDWQRLAAGINNKGLWTAGTNYRVNDAVSDLGSFWLATVSNTCEPAFPPDPCSANWQLLAAKGAAGAIGTAGAQGPQGNPGSMGFPGQQGPVGPIGPVGPMPTGAALTTTSNTFGASQTINGNLTLNGNLILTGSASGVQFPNGTTQTGAGAGGGNSCFLTSSVSPVPPPGYVSLGTSVNTASSWTTTAPLLTSRQFLAAASVSGKIYAIGGYTANNVFLSTNEVYDPSSNSWSTAASMPTARATVAAVAVNGKIYAIGGVGNAGTLNTVEVYDPSTNTWTTAASMPTARYWLTAAAVNGKIYAMGGSANAGIVNTVEVYDPSANTWSSAASMPTSRYDLASSVANGKIYALGGYTNAGTIANTVEVYDPSANTWTTAASMLTARRGLAADTLNGKMYALGGLDAANNTLNTVETYDSTSNTWSTGASMPTARASLAAADANGSLYTIGGGGGSGNSGLVVNTTEQFSASVTIYTFIKQ